MVTYLLLYAVDDRTVPLSVLSHRTGLLFYFFFCNIGGCSVATCSRTTKTTTLRPLSKSNAFLILQKQT